MGYDSYSWGSPRDKPLSPKIRAFLDDILEVYRRHNMSLAHEDEHGGFIVQIYQEHNIDWLMDADDETYRRWLGA